MADSNGTKIDALGWDFISAVPLSLINRQWAAANGVPFGFPGSFDYQQSGARISGGIASIELLPGQTGSTVSLQLHMASDALLTRRGTPVSISGIGVILNVPLAVRSFGLQGSQLAFSSPAAPAGLSDPGQKLQGPDSTLTPMLFASWFDSVCASLQYAFTKTSDGPALGSALFQTLDSGYLCLFLSADGGSHRNTTLDPAMTVDPLTAAFLISEDAILEKHVLPAVPQTIGGTAIPAFFAYDTGGRYIYNTAPAIALKPEVVEHQTYDPILTDLSIRLTGKDGTTAAGLVIGMKGYCHSSVTGNFNWTVTAINTVVWLPGVGLRVLAAADPSIQINWTMKTPKSGVDSAGQVGAALTAGVLQNLVNALAPVFDANALKTIVFSVAQWDAARDIAISGAVLNGSLVVYSKP